MQFFYLIHNSKTKFGLLCAYNVAAALIYDFYYSSRMSIKTSLSSHANASREWDCQKFLKNINEWDCFIVLISVAAIQSSGTYEKNVSKGEQQRLLMKFIMMLLLFESFNCTHAYYNSSRALSMRLLEKFSSNEIEW